MLGLVFVPSCSLLTFLDLICQAEPLRRLSCSLTRSDSTLARPFCFFFCCFSSMDRCALFPLSDQSRWLTQFFFFLKPSPPTRWLFSFESFSGALFRYPHRFPSAGSSSDSKEFDTFFNRHFHFNSSPPLGPPFRFLPVKTVLTSGIFLLFPFSLFCPLSLIASPFRTPNTLRVSAGPSLCVFPFYPPLALSPPQIPFFFTSFLPGFFFLLGGTAGK